MSRRAVAPSTRAREARARRRLACLVTAILAACAADRPGDVLQVGTQRMFQPQFTGRANFGTDPTQLEYRFDPIARSLPTGWTLDHLWLWAGDDDSLTSAFPDRPQLADVGSLDPADALEYWASPGTSVTKRTTISPEARRIWVVLRAGVTDSRGSKQTVHHIYEWQVVRSGPRRLLSDVSIPLFELP